MKNMADVETKLLEELDKWLKGQCANEWEEYYLWYRATTEKEPGDIIITANKAIWPNWDLGSSRILGCYTKNQHFNHLRDICRRLPILEY